MKWAGVLDRWSMALFGHTEMGAQYPLVDHQNDVIEVSCYQLELMISPLHA